jgi:hypothetical protein
VRKSVVSCNEWRCLLQAKIWEVTIKHLFSSSASQLVDEVWSWESVQHGDAALLNAENLTGTCKNGGNAVRSQTDHTFQSIGEIILVIFWIFFSTTCRPKRRLLHSQPTCPLYLLSNPSFEKPMASATVRLLPSDIRMGAVPRAFLAYLSTTTISFELWD